MEGTSYGDGSGARGWLRRLRRCGWGLATITDRNVYTAKLHGPLPGWQQDVPLAESYAFYVALRFSAVRCDYVTDCRFVLDTFQAGPGPSSRGWFVYAGLWREIWRAVDDIGSEQVSVRWVPAHTRELDVGVRISARDRCANDSADGEAKLGAAMHPHDEAVAVRTARLAGLVKQVGRFIGRANTRLGSAIPRDTDAVPRKHVRFAPSAARAARADGLRRSAHNILLFNGRLRCSYCLRSAGLRATLDATPCRPLPRAANHSLLEVGGFVFCHKCGYHSREKTRGLFGGCPGDQGTRGTFLRRLLEGRHPQTQESLRATPRPASLDTTVSTAPSRRRVCGKQVAGSDLGICHDMAGRPDFFALDSVVSEAGFSRDLEGVDEDEHSGPLCGLHFADGLA